jgi:hypothetical protein
VKGVPDVKWPVSPAHIGAFGPYAGRHDQGEGMSEEAVLTPSADERPKPQEVAEDVPGEVDSQEPE